MGTMLVHGVYCVCNTLGILVHMQDNKEYLNYKYGREEWKEAKIKWDDDSSYFMVGEMKIHLNEVMKV